MWFSQALRFVIQARLIPDSRADLRAVASVQFPASACRATPQSRVRSQYREVLAQDFAIQLRLTLANAWRDPDIPSSIPWRGQHSLPVSPCTAWFADTEHCFTSGTLLHTMRCYILVRENTVVPVALCRADSHPPPPNSPPAVTTEPNVAPCPTLASRLCATSEPCFGPVHLCAVHGK